MDASEIDPVEYVIIEFPGNQFTGDLAPALADLVARNLVRIIDLIFVRKDPDGSVSWFEYEDLDELADYADVNGDGEGLMSDEDIVELAEDLDLDSAALFIVWEDTWARGFGRAVRAAGGRIVAGERIPHHVVAEAFADLED